MSNDRSHPDPSPEQLTAFLDGELDVAGRARVEAWLADRPAAAAEIDGQRRVARLWGETPRPSQAPTPGRPSWLASKPDCPRRRGGRTAARGSSGWARPPRPPSPPCCS